MKREVLYYFLQSEVSNCFLSEILRLKKGGIHLGFTFENDNTHTCFTDKQEALFRHQLDPYIEQGLKFERIEYYRGNLSGEDFGVKTFYQPIVQWCPSPTISASTRSVFNKQEPWGLVTDGCVAMSASLNNTLSLNIWGLRQKYIDNSGAFDVYDLNISNINISKRAQEYETSPITIDARSLPIDADIWRTDNGVILCSLRLAKLLEEYWDGLPDIKFQPVICMNFSKGRLEELCRPLEKNEK